MQIANGFVTLCPEITHYVHGITPAEAVILKKLHNAYSNGTPLKFLVVVGDAMEVDEFGRPRMIGEQKPFQRTVAKVENGQTILTQVADFETVYTASTKPRTNKEEVNRLRRKYVGNVTVNGRNMPAWEASFGTSELVRLPETFEEVRDVIGDCFTYQQQPEKTETITQQLEAETAPAKRLGRPPKQQPEVAQA